MDMKNTMKILVLGHNGMLGNAVLKYFNDKKGYEVRTTNARFGNPDFDTALRETDAEVIINAIGTIPQKKPPIADYQKLNVELPRFLETLGKRIIHPSTDCEFRGNIAPGEKYTKTNIRDAEDVYGMSKADSSREIEEHFKHTKIIRTSIIGHELNSNLSLLDWFLAQQSETRGYTNHLWNGITTLEWAKLAENLINSWDSAPVLNQYGTADNKNKFDLLLIVREVYGKDISILPFETEVSFNKCLLSDLPLPSIQEQLEELKSFYGK